MVWAYGVHISDWGLIPADYTFTSVACEKSASTLTLPNTENCIHLLRFPPVVIHWTNKEFPCQTSRELNPVEIKRFLYFLRFSIIYTT
jgi:hypothetical protein